MAPVLAVSVCYSHLTEKDPEDWILSPCGQSQTTLNPSFSIQTFKTNICAQIYALLLTDSIQLPGFLYLYWCDSHMDQNLKISCSSPTAHYQILSLVSYILKYLQQQIMLTFSVHCYSLLPRIPHA